MFYMHTVYLELAASQERIKELRKREEDERQEADPIQVRPRHKNVLHETVSYKGVFPDAAWRMEHWRGAGW